MPARRSSASSPGSSISGTRRHDVAASRSPAGGAEPAPAPALLLLLTLTIATGMVSELSVYGNADAAWDRVWHATNGFHVSFTVYHPPDEGETRHAFVRVMERRAVELWMRTASWRRRARGPISTDRSRSRAGTRTSPRSGALPLRRRSAPHHERSLARSWRRPGLGERPRGDAGCGGRGHRDGPGTSLPGPRRRDHGRRAFPALQAGAGVGHAGAAERMRELGMTGGVRALAAAA